MKLSTKSIGAVFFLALKILSYNKRPFCNKNGVSCKAGRYPYQRKIVIKSEEKSKDNIITGMSSASKNGTSPWPSGRHYFTSNKENFDVINAKVFTTLTVMLLNPSSTAPNHMRQIKITGPRSNFNLMSGAGSLVTYVIDITDDFIVEDFDGQNHPDPIYSITGPIQAFTELANPDGSIMLHVASRTSNLTVNFLSINMERGDFQRVANQPSIITYYIQFFSSNNATQASPA